MAGCNSNCPRWKIPCGTALSTTLCDNLLLTYRCVSVGEIVDKVKTYAPKKNLQSREQVKMSVKSLWRVANGFDIDSEDWLREELDFNLSL